ncbi:hypothetical protein [Nostoc sp. CHAB 5715]|uniref:hypothetical protein n=1 Tax=Nostoc sp. CHAB 5715 TaxID=2780400 RepID=UPI001E4FCEAF|nr:hypothetical protein [Nostoc sp. CHAB 5715]MCC5622833.1 hypothetical protein [Nostoc sp. CHAB 5715]
MVGLGYPSGDRDCLPQTLEQVLLLLQRRLPRSEELERAIARCAALDLIVSDIWMPDMDTGTTGAATVATRYDWTINSLAG